MAGMNRLCLVLVGLLTWTEVCCARAYAAPLPVPPSFTRLENTPHSGAETLNQQPLLMSSASLPGSKVVWREAPRLRGVPAGLGPFLSDVESRLPRELGQPLP